MYHVLASEKAPGKERRPRRRSQDSMQLRKAYYHRGDPAGRAQGGTREVVGLPLGSPTWVGAIQEKNRKLVGKKGEKRNPGGFDAHGVARGTWT